MHFAGAVIICLLLYHRFIFCECSFLREKILFEEKTVLEHFLTETMLFLDSDNTRHVMVVGASNDQLRQTKSLLEAFPHFVGTEVEKFCLSRELAPHTAIIYFLGSLEKEFVIKAVESMSSCQKNRVFFIFEEVAVDNVDIELVLHLGFEKFAKRPMFIHCSEESLKFYGYELIANCSWKAELLLDWKPGVDPSILRDLHHRTVSYKGCPISVTARHYPPWMNIAEEANGTAKIIGGSEGAMISTIAQKMNWTPLVKVFKESNAISNRNAREVLLTFVSGNSCIYIGRIRPLVSFDDPIEMSSVYSQECTAWVIPRIPHNHLNIVTTEFSWSTWLLIGLAFLVSYGVEEIIRRTHFLNRANPNNSTSCSMILNFIGLSLGNPVVYHPLSMGAKVLLITYLSYSTVMTTAYKTSLASILTANTRGKSDVEAVEIINKNITPGGSVFSLSILQEQMETDEVVRKLVERFEIESNVSNALRRVFKDKNFAYLSTVSQLDYHVKLMAKAGEEVSFDMPKSCVLTYGNVMVLLRPLHLTEPINRMLSRFQAGGLLEYWARHNFKQNHLDSMPDKNPGIIHSEKELAILNRKKLYSLLYIYGFALTLCILVFLGELFVHNFKSMVKEKKIKYPKCYKIWRRSN